KRPYWNRTGAGSLEGKAPVRSLVMQGLTAAMCAGALLAFGVARAGETPSVPAGYHVVRENAHISPFDTISGFEPVGRGDVLIAAGSGLYLADLRSDCRFHADERNEIAVHRYGGGDIDRFADLVIGGRRCPIVSLTQVSRDPQERHQ